LLQTRGVLTHACRHDDRRERLHRVHRGVYAVGHGGLTLDAPFMAAVLACRGRAVVCHFSAAAHWGFVPWEERLPEVTVVGQGGVLRIAGVWVHRARRLDPRDVRRHRDIPVTEPARRPGLPVARAAPDRRSRRRGMARPKLAREHDAERQALLEAHGYRVLRVTWSQAVLCPQQTVARIRAALTR